MRKLICALLLCASPCIAYEEPEIEVAPDIVIMTLPKSGTYLLSKALFMLTREMFMQRGLYFVQNSYVYFDHVWPYYQKLKRDPDSIKILMMRDPRDMLVSQAFWIEKEKHWCSELLSQDQINAFLAMSLSDKISFLIDLPEEAYGLTEFVNAFLEWLKAPHAELFRFEDLIGPKGGGNRSSQIDQMKRLARILGMRFKEEEIIWYADQVFSNSPTFREGQIGSWKHYFSEEHKKRFKEKMGDALIQLGYETNNDW